MSNCKHSESCKGFTPVIEEYTLGKASDAMKELMEAHPEWETVGFKYHEKPDLAVISINESESMPCIKAFYENMYLYKQHCAGLHPHNIEKTNIQATISEFTEDVKRVYPSLCFDRLCDVFPDIGWTMSESCITPDIYGDATWYSPEKELFQLSNMNYPTKGTIIDFIAAYTKIKPKIQYGKEKFIKAINGLMDIHPEWKAVGIYGNRPHRLEYLYPENLPHFHVYDNWIDLDLYNQKTIAYGTNITGAIKAFKTEVDRIYPELCLKTIQKAIPEVEWELYESIEGNAICNKNNGFKFYICDDKLYINTGKDYTVKDFIEAYRSVHPKRVTKLTKCKHRDDKWYVCIEFINNSVGGNYIPITELPDVIDDLQRIEKEGK